MISPGVEIAGAIVYGLVIIGGDQAFTHWRARRVKNMAQSSGIGWFLGLTFPVRLGIYLAGLGLALFIFGPAGRFTVCLTALLAVPLSILVAGRLAKRWEG